MTAKRGNALSLHSVANLFKGNCSKKQKTKQKKSVTEARITASKITYTPGDPVAAEGGTSKEEHRRQGSRPRGRGIFHSSPNRHMEQESLYGDIPKLDVEKAIETARDREE